MNSPVREVIFRGADPTGYGWYGAKRGSRKHKGVDLLTDPGDNIFCPINGVITKLGYPYANTQKLRYIEITGDMYRIWLMYVKPINISVNDRVFIADIIGEAQDVSGHWGGKMKNHLHMQVWKFGLLTDPEPLL